MPEGDTIWRTAAALRPRILGRRVVRAEPAPIRRVAGRTVTRVEATGKHLVIELEGGLLLHSHMRMTGSWHLYTAGEPWQRPSRQMRALLEVEGGTLAVCFNAPVVELRSTAEAVGPVAHLGPDVLAETLDLDEVTRRIPASEALTAGELLLDQRVAAGIGNIWRCETLWRLGLDPWTPVSTLDEAALRRCYLTARELMRRSLAGGGLDRHHAVHARGGRPCRRCGTRIAVRAQGVHARLTYWCPQCQAPGSLLA